MIPAPLRFRALAAFIVVLCFNCRSPSDTASFGLTILTDRPSYGIRAGDVVHVRLVNGGEQPVYTSIPSYYLSLEVQHSLGLWLNLGPFWYGTVKMAGGVLAIDPGASLDGVELSTPFAASHGYGPGRYRFAYEIYSDAGLSDPLPLEARVSNTFEVSY